MLTIKERLLFIRRGGETQRFHSVLTVQDDTVGHHSFGVAWLLWVLTNGQARAELLMAGLAHDLAEHQVGDIPAPTKRNLEGMRKQIHSLEEELLHQAGLVFQLNEEEHRLLKLADALDGMIFCIRERTLGNSEIVAVYEKFQAYALEKFRLDQSEAESKIFNAVLIWWNEVHHE